VVHPAAGPLVEADARLALVRVDAQPLLDRGRVLVVGPARALAALDEAAHELVVGDVDHDHVADRAHLGGEDPVEDLGLGHAPRVAVEDGAVGHVVALEPLLDHGVGHVVAHELAGGQDRLDLEPERRPAGLVVAEHVARGDVRDAQGVLEAHGLGAFAAARGAEQDDEPAHGASARGAFRAADSTEPSDGC
jgi:hypothetical protein